MTDWEKIADDLASALVSLIVRSRLGGSEAIAYERYIAAKPEGSAVKPWIPEMETDNG